MPQLRLSLEEGDQEGAGDGDARSVLSLGGVDAVLAEGVALDHFLDVASCFGQGNGLPNVAADD